MRKHLPRAAFHSLPARFATPSRPSSSPRRSGRQPGNLPVARLPQLPAAAHVLSMVFISTANDLLGIPPPTTKDHAYPIRYSTRCCSSILAKLGFPPTALQIPKSQHTPKPKTMLSRYAANGLPAWPPAALVLSMVFSLWARQLLGFRTMDPQTPCLEHLPPRCP